MTCVYPVLGELAISCLTGMLLRAMYPLDGLTRVTLKVDLKLGSSNPGKPGGPRVKPRGHVSDRPEVEMCRRIRLRER